MIIVEAPVSICCGALYGCPKHDTVTRTGHIVGICQRAFTFHIHLLWTKCTHK